MPTILRRKPPKAPAFEMWTKPDRKSPFSRVLTRVSFGAATKSTPGGVGTGSASFHLLQPTTEEKIANMNYKASAAENSVKSAITKLLSTQEICRTTLDTYMKQSEQLLQVQDN